LEFFPLVTSNAVSSIEKWVLAVATSEAKGDETRNPFSLVHSSPSNVVVVTAPFPRTPPLVVTTVEERIKGMTKNHSNRTGGSPSDRPSSLHRQLRQHRGRGGSSDSFFGRAAATTGSSGARSSGGQQRSLQRPPNRAASDSLTMAEVTRQALESACLIAEEMSGILNEASPDDDSDGDAPPPADARGSSSTQ